MAFSLEERAKLHRALVGLLCSCRGARLLLSPQRQISQRCAYMGTCCLAGRYAAAQGLSIFPACSSGRSVVSVASCGFSPSGTCASRSACEARSLDAILCSGVHSAQLDRRGSLLAWLQSLVSSAGLATAYRERHLPKVRARKGFYSQLV